MTRILSLASLLSVLSVGAALAQAPSPVSAERPWARATAPQHKVGGGYVTLTSPADDRLISASSPVAGHVEVREMRMDGDVMRMRELADGLPLLAGKRVALSPGGFHIMLMDLKQPLVAGQSVPVQLRFQKAPPLDVTFQVVPIGASGPGMQGGAMTGGAMPGMAMPGMAGHGAMPGQTR